MWGPIKGGNEEHRVASSEGLGQLGGPCTPRGWSGLSQCVLGWQVQSRGGRGWAGSWMGPKDLGGVCCRDLGVGSQQAVWGLSCGLVRLAQQGRILSFTKTARFGFSASEIIGGSYY